MKTGFLGSRLVVIFAALAAGFGQTSAPPAKSVEAFAICDRTQAVPSAPCVRDPDLVHLVMPRYKKEDWPKVGVVVLSMQIGTSGVPDNIRVVQSMGEGLDEPVIAAVTEWRYKPATHIGEPVRVKANLKLNFYCGGDPVIIWRSVPESVQSSRGPKRLPESSDCWVNHSCLPIVIRMVEPKYSKETFSQELPGHIVLSLVVDVHGNTKDIRVVKSVTKEMDETAIVAVKQWRYKPALYRDQPVPANVRVEFDIHSCDVRWEQVR